ncbi:MAG: hypothetical protein ACM3NF_00485 [Gemmatimonadota bacterium]
MNKYLFMNAVLERLAQGPFFRKQLALCVRIAAAAAAMTALVGFVDAWNFTSHLEAGGIPGGIVYMLSLAAAAYMAVHAMLLRAGDIAALPQAGFTLIPIAGVTSRMIGEAYAAACAALAAGGGILIWFAGDAAYDVLRRVTFFIPFQGGGTFSAGILYILRGALRAVVVLSLGYLASELFAVVERTGGAAREAPGAE